MIGLVPAEKLEDYVGQDIGSSEWFEVDQDRIDMFADATLDHQPYSRHRGKLNRGREFAVLFKRKLRNMIISQ